MISYRAQKQQKRSDVRLAMIPAGMQFVMHGTLLIIGTLLFGTLLKGISLFVHGKNDMQFPKI